jgi:hypothetical protein
MDNDTSLFIVCGKFTKPFGAVVTLQQKIVGGNLDWITLGNRYKVVDITKQFGTVVESNFATEDC